MTLESRDNWRDTILAGLANYIDAGSIVAGATALALWKEEFGLSHVAVGLIAAFSANAISAGIGAIIGGILCDRYGRKTIYQFDMLFYAFGMLLLVFAAAPWMLIVGFIIVGLAVGADVPASWSLIAELAPDRARGKHCGLAQILWFLGSTIVLVSSLALAPLGVVGVRIVFAHLAIIALALTFLRSRMRESSRWEEARAARVSGAGVGCKDLFKPPYLSSMIFLIGVYGFWNLWAGTNGFFFPYILRTVGDQTQFVSVAVQTAGSFTGILSIYLVFMRYADVMNQRLLFSIAALMHVAAMLILAVLPFNLASATTYLLLISSASGFGAQSFFQLWSAEFFPTLVRSTAQGFCFAVVRIVLGVWSFFVPMLSSYDFHTLAWILVAFLAASGVIGAIWAPRHEGKSLEALADRKAVA
ncbi:MFS transporter, SP family, inositol transporter [Sphingobium sp. AP50]|uniref:MFS transporter n=1 Tax=Sphingobium sp. AP50 TaxID=1884369 RepID=UPI0008D7FDDF|nr:MFS transporter [Sphingobium sp. AP50]SEJ91318.1 MFS transporter, SP family, inositol transporter [Sphingobium sp. AP50]